MIPRVRKCCIGYSLPVGSRLIGAFLIVQAAVSLRLALHLAWNPRYMDVYGNEVFVANIVNGVAKTILGSVIITLSCWSRSQGICVQAVAVVLLLYHVAHSTNLTIIYARRFNLVPPLIMNTTGLLLGVYFFLVLWNYGLQLKGELPDLDSSTEEEVRGSTIV